MLCVSKCFPKQIHDKESLSLNLRPPTIKEWNLHAELFKHRENFPFSFHLTVIIILILLILLLIIKPNTRIINFIITLSLLLVVILILVFTVIMFIYDVLILETT
jgi:hypothetical protein